MNRRQGRNRATGKRARTTGRARKDAWQAVVDEVALFTGALRKRGAGDPFFRGERGKTWRLLPSMARRKLSPQEERRLYYNFISYGGHLIPQGATSWDTLFLMQHHGLPTRLLDWTENFAVALFFALRKERNGGAVWMLDPYALNKAAAGEELVVQLNSKYPDGYEAYFADQRSERYGKFPVSALAVSGGSRSTRIRSQRGVFTLHRDLEKPLDTLFPNVVRKVVIRREAVGKAQAFLHLAGINNYTLFPDLDGLARYLAEDELEERRAP